MTKEEFRDIQSRTASWMDYAVSFQFALDAIDLLKTAKNHYEAREFGTACASFSTQIISNYAHPFTTQKSMYGISQNKFPISKVKHIVEFKRGIHEDLLRLRNGIVGHSDHNFHHPQVDLISVGVENFDTTIAGLGIRIMRLESFSQSDGFEIIIEHIKCLQTYCYKQAQSLSTECDNKMEGQKPSWLVKVRATKSGPNMKVGTSKLLSKSLEKFVEGDLKTQNLSDLDLKVLNVVRSTLAINIATENEKNIHVK